MSDFPGCAFRFGFEREGYGSGFGFLGGYGGVEVDPGGWVVVVGGFCFGGGFSPPLMFLPSFQPPAYFLMHLPLLSSHEVV